MHDAWRPTLGAWPEERGVRFRVWAPDVKELHVVFESRFSSWVGEEMITLEHEAGDVWRLVGYSARPQSAI